MITDTILDSADFAGIHFTGSTGVFNSMWSKIGQNINKYKTYPRIVGETGGKDFVWAHPSSNSLEVATALARGAFEYQGQKCSAASRAYIPTSLWEDVKKQLVTDVSSLTNLQKQLMLQKRLMKLKLSLVVVTTNLKVGLLSLP